MKIRNITLALCLCMAVMATAAEKSIWEREQLTGDWGGKRSAWEDTGYTFTLEYLAEPFSNVSGGTKTGTVYQGLGYGALDIDGEKAFGLSGTSFHVSTMWIHGSSSGDYAGNELAVSNIDAYDGLRLHQVFVGQQIGKLNIRTGSLLADEDFVPSMYRDELINDSFGQNVSWSANTFNGGPAFFAAGLGIRFRYDFTDAWYAQAGIYDGDIFDDAGGDPTINQHGVQFELGNGQGWTSLYQIGYNGFEVSNGTDLPGWYRLTAWHHTTNFEKHAGGTGDGLSGVFASVDQMLYRDEGDQGLGAFGRYGVSERDKARFHWTIDVGLNCRGLFPGRDDDVTALAIIYGKHSSEIITTKSHEYVVELTYQYQLTPTIFIQPDIQWINRPSGDSSVGDAWLFGARVGFTF